jgi:hypothetical protein
MENNGTVQIRILSKPGYVPTKEVLNKAKQRGLLQGWSEATS